MGNTYMPKPENRYPNNVSGFEHIWELDMLRQVEKEICLKSIVGAIRFSKKTLMNLFEFSSIMASD